MAASSTFGKQTIFSFGQHRYNTLHHLQPWRNCQQNNHEHHHQQNAMQHIPYIPKYTSNQPFKNDFTQSFSLAFIIRKNALILYSFSEEKEVQNGLFYHFIYKTLVVNWSNMLHRQVKLIIYTQLSPKQNDERFSFIDSLGCSVLLSPISKQRLSII